MTLECKDVLLLLPEYINGELDNATIAKVVAHLCECDLCQQEASEIKEILGMLAKSEAPLPSKEFCHDLIERVITAAKSDPVERQIKAKEKDATIAPVATPQLVPEASPAKPIPIPDVKPLKVERIAPLVSSPKPKVEIAVHEPPQNHGLLWRWMSRGVLPVAAAILLLIITRNMFTNTENLDRDPDGTRPILGSKAPASVLASPSVTPSSAANPSPVAPSPFSTSTIAALKPDQPITEMGKIIGGNSTLNGMVLPSASNFTPTIDTKSATVNREEMEATDRIESGTTDVRNTVETSQSLSTSSPSAEKKSTTEGSLGFFTGETEQPAETKVAETTVLKDDADKQKGKDIISTSSASGYNMGIVPTRSIGKETKHSEMESLAGKTEITSRKNHSTQTQGDLPPKVMEAVDLLDLVGSPSPLVHEELLFISTESYQSDDATETVVDPDVPIATDEELLNTLNDMDKAKLDEIKNNIGETTTGGSQ